MLRDLRTLHTWTRFAELREGTRECRECTGRITWGQYKREVLVRGPVMFVEFIHENPPC